MHVRYWNKIEFDLCLRSRKFSLWALNFPFSLLISKWIESLFRSCKKKINMFTWNDSRVQTRFLNGVTNILCPQIKWGENCFRFVYLPPCLSHLSAYKLSSCLQLLICTRYRVHSCYAVSWIEHSGDNRVDQCFCPRMTSYLVIYDQANSEI